MFKTAAFATFITLSASPFALAQDFVAPGTELSVGDEAIVPFLLPEGPEVPISLVVSAIEKGDIADLSAFELPPEAEGAQPYYIRFAYENLGEEDLSNYAVSGFVGMGDDGVAVTPTVTMGGSEPFTQCQNEPATELTNGASHEGCVMFLIDGDTSLDSVGYRGNYRYVEGEDTESEYPLYYNPVYWTAAADATAPKSKDKDAAPTS